MNGRHIDNVIFDIGNVLLRWRPERLFQTFFPDAPAMALFLGETGILVRNLAFDGGEPFGVGIADLTAKHPHYAAPLGAFDARWIETIEDVISESVDILASLRAAGVPTYAITNFSREKFTLAVKEFPFLGGFEDIVVSADVGLLKPDPAIFRLLLDRTGLDPARTLFIDDSADNIAAARVLGLKTHHFDEANAGALKRDCLNLGLPVRGGDACMSAHSRAPRRQCALAIQSAAPRPATTPVAKHACNK